MGVLDFLKKIGVIQAGAGAAVYTKASDRPDYLDEDGHGFGKDKKPKAISDEIPTSRQEQNAI